MTSASISPEKLGGLFSNIDALVNSVADPGPHGSAFNLPLDPDPASEC
jgi:hypothetical protein